jgi:hypothetical protein
MSSSVFAEVREQKDWAGVWCCRVTLGSSHVKKRRKNMNKLRLFALSLLVLGVSSHVSAWHITVVNKTPYTIRAKSKSWGGLLDGPWITVGANQSGQAGTGGADCIDGVWLKVLKPGTPLTDNPDQDFTDMGYFGWSTNNHCSDGTVVVSVQPIIAETTQTTERGAAGVLGEMLTRVTYHLKQMLFYVSFVMGEVKHADSKTVINF